MSISERRSDNRFLCADLVRVGWGGQEVDAVLEDISAFGACVQLEEAVALGAPVTLTIGLSVFPGRVSYCVFRDYGYFVGVRFADENEWSAERVVPQHLTDLNRLGMGADSRV
jgi:hypothetical protein